MHFKIILLGVFFSLYSQYSFAQDVLINYVERMPLFSSPTCDTISNYNVRQDCATKALVQFIYENLDYPEVACEQGITGTVVIQFKIDCEGQHTDFQILRSIGGGCDEEAMRIAKLLPNFVPTQRFWGKCRTVDYVLPVRFQQ